LPGDRQALMDQVFAKKLFERRAFWRTIFLKLFNGESQFYKRGRTLLYDQIGFVETRFPKELLKLL
jgi:hypothetical protein